MYNTSGYKVFTVFIFGEASVAFSKSVQCGTVIGLLNPKVMPKKPDDPQGISFCVDSEASIL